jgi:ABC-type lipoprotein release transport system permease subunit
MSTIRTVSFLAMKDLRRDKKIAVLVICLIAFSYLNITFFSGFINGLGNTFQESVVNTATSHIIITPSDGTNAKYVNSVTSLRKKVDLNGDVIATTARLGVPVTITFKDREFSLSATAVRPSEEMAVTTVSTFIVDGSFLTDGSDGEIVLGRIIAGEQIEDSIGKQRFGQLIEGLGVRVGEVVTLKYPSGLQKDYRVRGIVSSEGFNFVSQSAFITFSEAEKVLGTDDQASSVLIKLNDRYKADTVKSFILEQGVKNVEVRTWLEASSFVGAITSTFSVVILVTAMVGIVVVIATIGIVVFINTARKKRIIGVLKAIGMSSDQIMFIFLFQSIVFGLIGTGVGIGIYSVISYLIAQNPITMPIGQLKLVLPIESAASVAVVIIVSSLIAGYVPARMASRAKILDNIKTVE